MPTPLFPNLFIVGAMKSGTSSLHEYLHQHPQIFMSRFKEPQYFAPHKTKLGYRWGQGNPCPEPGIAWYLRLFESAGDVMYAGESSVSYTARPVISGCERRIFQFNPKARILYLMREPVERTISHYWHNVTGGVEDRAPLAAIRRCKEYVARSHYARQLAPYFNAFGRDRVFVLTIEELSADPETVFRRIFRWLGVSPHAHIDVSSKLNVGHAVMSQTRRGLVFADTALKHWRWKRVEPLVPTSFTSLARRLVYRSITRQEVDLRPLLEYVTPLLGDFTKELATLLGRDFPEWQPSEVRLRLDNSVKSGAELSARLTTTRPSSESSIGTDGHGAPFT